MMGAAIHSVRRRRKCAIGAFRPGGKFPEQRRFTIKWTYRPQLFCDLYYALAVENVTPARKASGCLSVEATRSPERAATGRRV